VIAEVFENMSKITRRLLVGNTKVNISALHLTTVSKSKIVVYEVRIG